MCGYSGGQRMQGSYVLFAQLAIYTSHTDGIHLPVIACIHPPNWSCEEVLFGVRARRDGDAITEVRIQIGYVTAFKVQLATIIFRNVLNINELRKGWKDLMVRKDEDFRGGDRVEPTLDPAPDRGEEGRGAKNL